VEEYLDVVAIGQREVVRHFAIPIGQPGRAIRRHVPRMNATRASELARSEWTRKARAYVAAPLSLCTAALVAALTPRFRLRDCADWRGGRASARAGFRMRVDARSCILGRLRQRQIGGVPAPPTSRPKGDYSL
jgi:hypothetical protein